MKKVILFLIITFVPMLVSAQNNNFCNLTTEEISNIRNYLNETDISKLSCDMLNGIKNDKNITIDYKKYNELLYDDGINSYNYLIDENSIEYIPQASNSHTTTYKKLNVTVLNSVSSDGSYKYISVEADLIWKKMPRVRDFDAFGLVVSNGNIGFSSSDFHLIEVADNNATRKNYTFVNDTNNRGYAFVFGINANASRVLTYKLYTKGTVANNPSKVNVSYQHATTKLSLNDATSINFSTSGYGGVFNYRTANARNSYDQMAGLSFNLNW
jgi:hypothetical protein